jgi:hypothetical protein
MMDMAAKPESTRRAIDHATNAPKKKKGVPRFAQDVMRVLGGQVAMTAMGVLTGIITARWLGPTDRGLFNLLVLLPTVLSNFVKLGIPQASVYYMRRKNVPASEVASNSLWFAITMGSALAIVCWFGRDWLLANVLKQAPESLVARMRRAPSQRRNSRVLRSIVVSMMRPDVTLA